MLRPQDRGLGRLILPSCFDLWNPLIMRRGVEGMANGGHTLMRQSPELGQAVEKTVTSCYAVRQTIN